MKKRVISFLMTVLLIAVAIPMAMPVTASNGSYDLYGIIGGQYLVTVDPVTGDATQVAVLSGPIDSVNAIAFDSNTGTLYGLARTGGNHRPLLATIAVCTGDVTVILGGAASSVVNVQGLGTAPAAREFPAISFPPVISKVYVVSLAKSLWE